MVRRTTVSPDTLQRVRDLCPENLTVDQFINILIDYGSGDMCSHTNRITVMSLPTDEKGYIDIPATLEQLDHVRRGRMHKCLYRICLRCNRVEGIHVL